MVDSWLGARSGPRGQGDVKGVCATACGSVAEGSGLVGDVILVRGRWRQVGGRFREVSVRVISAAGVARRVYRAIEVEDRVWALVRGHSWTRGVEGGQGGGRSHVLTRRTQIELC